MKPQQNRGFLATRKVFLYAVVFFEVQLGEIIYFLDQRTFMSPKKTANTVDGRNPANQLRSVVYPIIYKGFYTSQVVFSPDFFQQHDQP